MLYAWDWALTINTNWGNYEASTGAGGDCTNFTSQCIKAGGIPFDNYGINSSEHYRWYWYSGSNRVSPWTGAAQFNEYARINTSGPGLRASFMTWNDIMIGDIVQTGGSYPSTGHSMFVSGYVYSGPQQILTDYLICQHSTYAGGRLKNVPLSTKGTSVRSYIVINGWSN